MTTVPLSNERPEAPLFCDGLGERVVAADGAEALAALEEMVADDSMYVAAPVALETFLSRYIAALLELPNEMLPAPQAAAFTSAPAATHHATSTMPSGVFQPAAVPAASNTAAFEALPSTPGAHAAPSTPAPSFTVPAAHTPSAPAAIRQDTWADAAPPAGRVVEGAGSENAPYVASAPR